MRTRDVFIAICEECNTLHVEILKSKVFSNNETTLTCKQVVDFTEAEEEGGEPTPILCENQIELSEEDNFYTVKRWNFKERSAFYERAGVFQGKRAMNVQEVRMNINSKDLHWVIQTGAVKMPIENTEEAIGEMDGAIAESVFASIMEFNMPPLGRSSVSR